MLASLAERFGERSECVLLVCLAEFASKTLRAKRAYNFSVAKRSKGERSECVPLVYLAERHDVEQNTSPKAHAEFWNDHVFYE